MCPVHGFQVHERTAPYNAAEPARLTLLDRLLRNTALAEGAVEPDATYAALMALPYQLNRNLRVRCNHDAVHGARNGDQIRETRHVLDLSSGWIDGKSFVTGVAELTKNEVSGFSAIPGNASHCDALATKEISYGIRKGWHGLARVRRLIHLKAAV